MKQGVLSTLSLILTGSLSLYLRPCGFCPHSQVFVLLLCLVGPSHTLSDGYERCHAPWQKSPRSVGREFPPWLGVQIRPFRPTERSSFLLQSGRREEERERESGAVKFVADGFFEAAAAAAASSFLLVAILRMKRRKNELELRRGNRANLEFERPKEYDEDLTALQISARAE